MLGEITIEVNQLSTYVIIYIICKSEEKKPHVRVSAIGLTDPAYVAALSKSCYGMVAKVLMVAIRGRVGGTRAGTKKRRRARKSICRRAVSHIRNVWVGKQCATAKMVKSCAKMDGW